MLEWMNLHQLKTINIWQLTKVSGLQDLQYIVRLGTTSVNATVLQAGLCLIWTSYKRVLIQAKPWLVKSTSWLLWQLFHVQVLSKHRLVRMHRSMGQQGTQYAASSGQTHRPASALYRVVIPMEGSHSGQVAAGLISLRQILQTKYIFEGQCQGLNPSAYCAHIFYRHCFN